MPREIPISEGRVLRTESRGCCALCGRDLVGGGPGAESDLSEMAHMRGLEPGSARHNPTMRPGAVNKCPDLILPCHDCHKAADDHPDVYATDRLEAAKSKHEARARRQAVGSQRDTSFAELEAIARWIAGASAAEAGRDYSIAPPPGKVKKTGCRTMPRCG